MSPHIKRPLNVFMIWSKEARKNIIINNPTISNGEISRILGKLWAGMSDIAKRPYKEKAALLIIEHKLQYPFYKYKPKKHVQKIIPSTCDKKQSIYIKKNQSTNIKKTENIKQSINIKKKYNKSYKKKEKIIKEKAIHVYDESDYYKEFETFCEINIDSKQIEYETEVFSCLCYF